MPDTITGGCQCGAVRYRITAPFENAHICHCRMCQKAFGNYFAPSSARRRRVSSGRRASRPSSEVPRSCSAASAATAARAFALLHSLPGTRTEDDIPPEDMKRLKSRQQPDHD
jgi:hypothetical protein